MTILKINIEIDAKAPRRRKTEVFKAAYQALARRGACFRIEMLIFCPEGQVTPYQ